MSNFADMAYDNYLMHYRTKGSKNGFTKDPDYTPVGEKAVAKKVLRDKIDKLVEENKKKQYGQIWKLSNQAYRGERFQGDFAGMPSSDAEQFRAKRVRDANNRYDSRMREIDRLSKQKTRGDYAGMPSSALKAKERAERGSEIKRFSNQASKGDLGGMPSSAREAKERNAEIKKLHGQANRGDLGGMPSSAREAKEKAERASEISRLSKQFGRKGETGGMPSSDYEAMSKATLESSRRKRDEQEKRNEEISKITKNPWLRAYRQDYSGMPSSAKDAALDAYRKTLEKRSARKEAAKSYARSVEINKLSKQAARGDYAGMPSSVKEAQARAKEEKRDRMKASAEAKRKAEYMKAKAEDKRKKEYDIKARKDEINKLSEQASRGDLGGMPSSARSGNAYVKNRLAFKEWARKEREKDAREKALRNLQIDKLSRQKSKGDYAGMPSSAREAKEKVIRDKAWGIGFEAQRKYEKIREEKEEAKRKKNPKAYAGGKRLMMPK